MPGCPTCGAVMLDLDVPDARVSWCAGCGTLRSQGRGFDDEQRPALVQCCRDYRDQADGGRGLSPADAALWQQLGLPNDRRPPT